MARRSHEPDGERLEPAQEIHFVCSHNKLPVKHLAAYLDEFTFRFKGREPYLFSETLLRLLDEGSLTYEELVHQAEQAPHRRLSRGTTATRRQVGKSEASNCNPTN